MFAMMARTTRAAAAAAKRNKQKEESSSQISKREEKQAEEVEEVGEVEEVEDDEDLGVSVHNTQTFAAMASQVVPTATITESSKKRKGAAEEEVETMRAVKRARGKKSETIIPAARTVGVRMLVGAHVSMAGGVYFLSLGAG